MRALFRTETGDAAGAETAWLRSLELAGKTGARAFIERRLRD